MNGDRDGIVKGGLGKHYILEPAITLVFSAS